MSSREKYRDILALLGTVGAVGVPLLIGPAALANASNASTQTPRSVVAREPVFERLAAIREAVSAIAAEKHADASAVPYRLAWANIMYNLDGSPNFRFPNWHNWHNFNYLQPWGNWGNTHLQRYCIQGPIYPVCGVHVIPNN
jgi:hypothetical protein